MHGHVVSAERLTPAMVRVVLGGGDLDRFEVVDATDAYVNLVFAQASGEYDRCFDPAEVAATRPRHQWPVRRRYTVRRWDVVRRELTIDFVVHGSEGVAGAWAASAAPGDCLVLEGPAGGYRPSTSARWHLLVGDESALPAIAATVESLPPGSVAVVRLVCDGPAFEVALETRAELDLAWMHRTGSPADHLLLVRSVEELTFRSGAVHAFVHGEAEEIRGVRRHLLQERGLSRSDMSCSPYWRRSMTDDTWRQVKQEFVTAMEGDVA